MGWPAFPGIGAGKQSIRERAERGGGGGGGGGRTGMLLLSAEMTTSAGCGWFGFPRLWAFLIAHVRTLLGTTHSKILGDYRVEYPRPEPCFH